MNKQNEQVKEVKVKKERKQRKFFLYVEESCSRTALKKVMFQDAVNKIGLANRVTGRVNEDSCQYFTFSSLES